MAHTSRPEEVTPPNQGQHRRSRSRTPTRKKKEDNPAQVSWADAISQGNNTQKRKMHITDRYTEEISALKNLILEIKAENALLKEKLEKYEKGETPTTEPLASTSAKRTTGIQLPKNRQTPENQVEAKLEAKVQQHLNEFRSSIRTELKLMHDRIIQLLEKTTVSNTHEQATKRKLPGTGQIRSPKQMIVERDHDNMETETEREEDDEDP